MSERPIPRRVVRETTSFRLPAETLARLDARAALLGTTRTTLAAQFLEEGIRLVEHPGIVFTDGTLGERRATIAGTRLDVWMVVEVIRASNNSVNEAADYLQIPVQWVEAAARYYAAHPDEISEEIRLNDEFAERETRLAAEQRKLLG
ncbi:MAG TPA: hypothetical protein VIK13_17580 [Candidatus Limnocylindrales bacterium]